MDKEKSLVETGKKNIIMSIIDYIKNFLTKKLKSNHCSKENMDYTNLVVEKKKTLWLQECYENGEINEANLTKEEKVKLIELYNEQILNLKNEIEECNIYLNFYKEQILEKRNQLNNK